jgi:3-(3-hydroxy-phenyl)propionate hydroxylase
VLLDDAIGNRLAVIGWGTDPTFGLTAQARQVWERLGACFVIAKPDVQLSHTADVPQGVIALGDVTGRLKEWFGRLPESVVLLRPDRFVAGVCTPQQVSRAIGELAVKLGLNEAQQGEALQGEAQRGEALQGEAQQGEAQQGEAQRDEAQRDEAQRDSATVLVQRTTAAVAAGV